MRNQLQSLNSRSVWGSVLFLAAAFSLAGATIFQALGLTAPDFGPMPFVGAIIFLKLGLFSFWPVIAKKGREASMTLHDASAVIGRSLFAKIETAPRSLVPILINKPKSLSLWDQHDPRLDLALFFNNVPSFVLNHEQRFLDWNPAFELVFGERRLKRGAHVSSWFGCLDNYRRVSKRTEKLYGEGILPIADRDRVVYVSALYGRMVFTKIMTPIMDRSSGRVIGWNVVLNINSVTKRQQFFTKLHSRLSLETRRARYAASYNGLFEKYRAQRDLIALHMQSVGEAYRVLEVGAGSGLLTSELVKVPRRVTAVDHNIHLLRQLRDRVALISRRVKVVKQNPDDLRSLPASRYEAAVMMNTLHKLEDPLTCLKKIFDSLIPGGSISVSFLTCGPAIDPLFKALRTDLESQNCYDQLQHQFTHVLEHERELAAALPYRILTRVDVRALLLEAGFALQTEVEGLFGGHALFLTARKPD